MKRLTGYFCAALLLAGSSSALAQEGTTEASAPLEPQASDDTIAAKNPDLVVARGKDRLPLVIPANEKLIYDIVLDVALIGRTRVGSLVLSSGVEAFREGLPRAGQPVEASTRRAGWTRAVAKGGYLGYSMEHTIESRLLPQEWPAVIVRNTQSGTESRSHHIMYGRRNGQDTLWYRRTHHCKGCDREEHFLEGGLTRRDPYHCPKCKRGEHRIWASPSLKTVPGGAVDMLTAIHLARSLVLSESEQVGAPLLDKSCWWDLTLSRGDLQVIKVPAGEFRAQAIKLAPGTPEGEERTERFKGLFGIHGTLSIWLDTATGVPLRIEGIVPLGPLDLDVSVELRNSSGVPAGFLKAK
ncbi:MAG: hypothetical protein ACI8QC_004357 [Planctomycetota bacterium]|jgi:hypothetical protein